MNSLIDKCKEKNLLFTQQITNVITKQCFAGDQGRQFPLPKTDLHSMSSRLAEYEEDFKPYSSWLVYLSH